MDSTRFWQYKIVQFFHDPPGKPYASWRGTGGHKAVAGELFNKFTGLDLKGYARYPDWAASGADRPMVTPPRQTGVSPLSVSWHKRPLITHPLAEGYRLDLRRWDIQGELMADADIKDEILEEQTVELEELGKTLGHWGSREELESGFFRLWRKFRDELVFRNSSSDRPLTADMLWAEMPADTRCPDHSIWDHLRVTTALAFLTRKTPGPEVSWAPWLFRFSIGPVQRFIQESRTTRDLWSGSFLLSDLVWHAMLPLIERYGPDCILYPDLRGNPRTDVWLCEKHGDVLPGFLTNPSTFAAMLPGTFMAVLPRGNQGHLKRLEDVAADAQESFRKRWLELSGMVKSWLESRINKKEHPAWRRTWDRQHDEPPLYAIWSAVPWMMAERPLDPETRKERSINPESLRARALPAQRPGFRQPSSELEPDIRALELRRKRLAPWVTPDIWARYELAREVYLRTNEKWTTMERGFDYALTHHQLVVRHGLRKQAAPDPVSRNGEPGEKCSLCGKRTALGGEAEGRGSRGYVDNARQAARKLWMNNKDLDPEQKGAERLCAVCAMKRFLVDAGYHRKKRTLLGINPVWAGPKTPYEDVEDADGRVRVPFPSSATLAAQEFLEQVALDTSFTGQLDAVNRAHRDAGLPRTNFPRALPRLAAAYKKATPQGKEFLTLEAQETLFPHAVEGMVHCWEKSGHERIKELKKFLKEVKGLCGNAKTEYGRPKTRMAVICIDGDRMGQLITGEAASIEARWQDVLHPEAVERLKKNSYLIDAGWLDLLSAKRLTGPSLHAFINRALGHFSHRIAPWVVEQEFSGRLIYAGGDDVLCLAPADHALDIAARLMQLFSAAWIIDTDYRADPWDWRRRNWTGEYDPETARRRFLIPKRPGTKEAIRLPVSPEQLEPHCADPETRFASRSDGVLLPMLGHGCSLSAGIVYGHYKTPLGTMLAEARRLLDNMAKEKAGRRAIALGHFSRNGLKTGFAIPWDEGGPMKGVSDLKDVRQGFEEGVLSKRLPYKLREIMPLITAARRQILRESDREKATWQWNRLLAGFFANACSGMRKNHFRKAAFRVWQQGVKLYVEQGGSQPALANKAVDGLLTCRYLAFREDEEQ